MSEHVPVASVSEAIRRLVDSWNRRDARGFGSVFTPDAKYVTGAGQHIRGRESIGGLVDSNRDASKIAVVDGPFVEMAATTATARFGWSTASDGGVPRRGTITCSLAWHGTGWLIDALHNEESG